MQEFVLGETGRIDKFKIALYKLDCWQILNRPFLIPDNGFVKSSTGSFTAWGSLGFVQARELGPVRPTLFKAV
jgi:hypothetical protein